MPQCHQTFQVPKMEVFTYISCMDTAYGYGKTHPKGSGFLHFRSLKFLVTMAGPPECQWPPNKVASRYDAARATAARETQGKPTGDW